MSSVDVKTLVQNLDEKILNDDSIDSSLFEKLTAAQRELGLVHGTRPTCPFLRPVFLSKMKYNEITKAAVVLAKAFEHLVDAALQDKSLMNELGLTEREESLARIETGYKALCVTSRLDAFLHEDGFKFLEYNAESPAGLADQMQLEKVLAHVPPVRGFLSEHNHWTPKPHEKLLENLVDAYLETNSKNTKPQIGIIDWKGVSTESEFFVLKDYFESCGFPTIVADPHDLNFDGEHLYNENGFRIDIFYKRVIIHELLEKFDDTHPIIRAYKAQKICMANSLRTKVAHTKAGFAILSNERYEHLFSTEQQEMIHRHIPWTRHVREEKTTYQNSEIDLLEFVRNEKEKFALKPNDDYGGKGITLGWEAEQSEWEKALNAALGNSFIVQERAPVQKTKIPAFNNKAEEVEMLVDFNPFLFSSGAEGALIRLSSSSLVNITQGGGQTALVVLED